MPYSGRGLFVPILSSYRSTMAPIKLVTVNTVPARAKRIVGIITEQVKDKYEIVHVANVDRK